jgi:hypothetical protein
MHVCIAICCSCNGSFMRRDVGKEEKENLFAFMHCDTLEGPT